MQPDFSGGAPQLALSSHVAPARNQTFGYPRNQVNCTVVSCIQISPNFKRLRLAGDFSAFAAANAGLHFCLQRGPHRDLIPFALEGGKTIWPGGGVKNWHRPPYTVRHLSSQFDWIDIDIFQHDGGRVTGWCDTVQPGERIAIHGPSGSKCPSARWLGLIGDETALPVILRILEMVPSDTLGQVFIALRDPQDIQFPSGKTQVTIQRMDPTDPRCMLAAIDRLQPPITNRHIFFGGELSLARAARVLFAARGWSRHEAHAAGYWSSTD